ncbi:MAG: hypothetical protein SNI70_09760 [Rikenellaceae bacterium]
MNTQLSNTAYSTIANNILSNLPDENMSYEVEVEMGNLIYFVDVEYSADYRDCECSTDRGTQYFSELDSEQIDVTAVVVYNNDTDNEYFATDAEIDELMKYIN